MKTFIVEGFLYGTDMPEQFVLSGEKFKYESFLSEPVPNSNLTRFTACSGKQPCLIKEDTYTLTAGEITVPVTSVISHRVAVHQTDKGTPLPFTDDVYPVICNNQAEHGAEIVVHTTEDSRNPDKCPQLITDGNTEFFMSLNQTKTYTYPKTITPDEPDVFYDNTLPESFENKTALKHSDCLEVRFDGTTVLSFLWDQITKIWYIKKNPDEYPLARIKGGTYAMGDYRGKLYNYSYGRRNTNLKKFWETVCDPQYMGETAVGNDAVGVAGLREENTLASAQDSDFWCFNEDALCVHDVKISDFELGKYQVTMEQYYQFVNAISGEDEQNLFYEIDGQKYKIHWLAGMNIWAKKQRVRDNGWGLGDRPAVNVSFGEIAEFCNWMSRRYGYEPAYTIYPLFDGKHQEGLTKANIFRYVEGSRMQIKAFRNQPVQLVDIQCDRSKNGFRLPYEAEFEYVIRGGENIPDINNGHGFMYSGIVSETDEFINDVAWQRKNVQNPRKDGFHEADPQADNMSGNGYTSPVGNRVPNCFGIYDMSGNVWEMQGDIFSRTYFDDCKEAGVVENPEGPKYSLDLLSHLNEGNADRYFKDRYRYLYETQEDGSMKRTAAFSLATAGKTHHALKGGCFANPTDFVCSYYRHVASGFSHLDNFVNHYFSPRTGFRMARTVCTEKEVQNV